MAGTHQIFIDRREREHTDIERQACNRDMAGHMVFGVPEWKAKEEGAGYHTGGEDVKGGEGLRRYMRHEAWALI
jgi:hypothetical protein